MPIVANRFYNDPSVGAVMGGIAQLFAPPSAQELMVPSAIAAKQAEASKLRAETQATLDKAQRISEFYADAKDPDFDRATFDRMGIATGSYAPNQSYYSVDQNNATTQRGQDVSAATSRANNAADNTRALQTNQADNARALQTNQADNETKLTGDMLAPVGPGATRFVPPKLATLFNVAPIQSGTVTVGQGEMAATPDGRTVQGQAKPITDDQLKAAIMGQQPAADQRAWAMGSTPTTTIVGPGGKPQMAYSTQAAATGAQPATGGRPMTAAERQSYGVPDGVGAFMSAQGEPHVLSSGGSQVNVTNRAESAFDAKVGTDQAELFGGLAKDAIAARQDRSSLDQLRGQIDRLPGGMTGGMQALANSYGLKLGPNADAVEAASAIISRMVPAARQGLPGAASDRDVAMFRQSLPALSNTPAGNKLIMDSLSGLAAQREAAGRIATDVMNGRMTRQAGMDALAALPDPLGAFKAATQQSGGSTGAPPEPAQAPVQAEAATPGVTTTTPAARGDASAAPAAPTGDMPTVRSAAEAMALPKGTRFRTPDGRVKVR